MKQGFIVQPLHCQMMGVKCDRNEGNEVGRCPVINNSGPVKEASGSLIQRRMSI